MIALLLAVRQSVRIFLAVLYVGCVVVLSLLPPQDFPEVPLFEGIDKVIHFLMYLILSLLLCWAQKAEQSYSRMFFVIPISIGWGVFMEWLQLIMHSGRSFSWFDILANSIGAIIGILIYLLASRKYAD